MEPTKIDHLGIAVEDLDQAAKVYEAMGLRVAKTVDVPEQKVRVALIPIGDTRIELIQPTSPDSAVARYLQRRGQGLHHVALQVDDIESCLADLKGQGFWLIDGTLRQGAEGQIAFVHPDSTGGTLIELVEPD